MCFISLKCGEQIAGPNVVMKSHLTSPAKTGPEDRCQTSWLLTIFFAATSSHRNLVNFNTSKPAKKKLYSFPT